MRVLTFLFVGMSLCFSMMSRADDEPRQSVVVAEQVNGNNAFAFDLFQYLKSKKENILFSPYSISSAFAMTAIGAAGETKIEMDKVFHFFADSSALASAFSNLNSQLITTHENEQTLPMLFLANSLWVQKGFPLIQFFQERLIKNFHSSINEVDFKLQANQSRQVINQWVEEKTRGKIKGLFPPNALNDKTRLVLVSALYMQAKWNRVFEKSMTAQEPFYSAKDVKSMVDMMNHTGFYRLFVNPQVAMIEIPYAIETSQDPVLAMVIVLPKSVEGLASLENIWHLDQAKAWMKQMKEQNVHLAIPKFKIEEEISLKETLAAMGLRQAFSGNADFSTMTHERNLSIDKAIHKAFMAVDENGTEAAAATAVAIGLTSYGPGAKPYHFLADHPFLFMIIDKKTDSILFMGRMAKP